MQYEWLHFKSDMDVIKELIGYLIINLQAGILKSISCLRTPTSKNQSYDAHL